MRKVNTVVLHYSATYEDMDIGLKEIRDMHRARGWSREGYHEIIRLSGRREQGRPWEMIGSGVKGQNTGKLHICCIGGLKRAHGGSKGFDTRTFGQQNMTVAVIREMEQKFGKLRVVGHSELASTMCPGFIGSKWWNAGWGGGVVDDAVPSVTRGYCKFGSQGIEVLSLQDALRKLGYFEGKSTGYFGRVTERAVKEFQTDNKLVVDGKVGPVTWATISQKGIL